MTPSRVNSMIASVIAVEQNQIKFLRYGEEVPRNHLLLAHSPFDFPYDKLVKGETYAIVTQYENGLFSWVEAYHLGAKLASSSVSFKKGANNGRT